MKNIFVLAIVVIFGSNAFAEADLNPNIFNMPATPAPAAAGTGTGAATLETPRKTPGIAPIGGSINPGSQQGQQSQKSGAGSNAAAGAALMAAGAALMASGPPGIPPGVILMAMGMMAMKQSKEDSGAAGQSAATGAASITNDGTVGNTTPVDSKGTAGLDAKIKEGQAKLGEAGYKLTDKGLVSPDGKVIPTKAFDSASSMSAAGISPSTVATVQSALTDAEAGAMSGARVSSVGVNTGGGSGGGVTEGDSNGSSASDTGHSNPFGMNADQRASLVAGKTVMFDGEPIGVRGQNIFDMVHNCYQKKRQGQHFIESEVDVATRMPANVRRPPKK